MKHIVYLAFLFSIFFTACKKKDPVVNKEDKPEIISDVTLKTSKTVPFVLSAPENNIVLSASNLPAGVTSTFEKDTGNFFVRLILIADLSAKQGVYPITITKTTGAESKIYNIKLTIEDGCDYIFTGKYAAKYEYKIGTPPLSDNLIEAKIDPTDVNKVIITNLMYDGTSVTGTRNCDMTYLDLDAQQINSGSLAGYQIEYSSGGSFMPPTMSIQVKKGTQAYNYKVILTRQ